MVKKKKKIVVHVPDIQQQFPGTLDCGLFAIANLVEFCINGYPELKSQSRNWNFDVDMLRPHLISCIKNDKFESFPKVCVYDIKIALDIYDIKIDCPCGLANVTEGIMVNCERCEHWFHQFCSDAVTDSPWLCFNCKNKRTKKRPQYLA